MDRRHFLKISNDRKSEDQRKDRNQVENLSASTRPSVGQIGHRENINQSIPPSLNDQPQIKQQPPPASLTKPQEPNRFPIDHQPFQTEQPPQNNQAAVDANQQTTEFEKHQQVNQEPVPAVNKKDETQPPKTSDSQRQPAHFDPVSKGVPIQNKPKPQKNIIFTILAIILAVTIIALIGLIIKNGQTVNQALPPAEQPTQTKKPPEEDKASDNNKKDNSLKQSEDMPAQTQSGSLESFNADNTKQAVKVVLNSNLEINFFYKPQKTKACKYYIDSKAISRNLAETNKDVWIDYSTPLSLFGSNYSHVLAENCGDWDKIEDPNQRNEIALAEFDSDNVSQAISLIEYWVEYDEISQAAEKEFYYRPNAPNDCQYSLASQPLTRQNIDKFKQWSDYQRTITVDVLSRYLISKNCQGWKKVNGILKSESKPVPTIFNADRLKESIEVVDDYKDNFYKEFRFRPASPQQCQYLDRFKVNRELLANTINWSTYSKEITFDNVKNPYLIAKNCGDWRRIEE